MGLLMARMTPNDIKMTSNLWQKSWKFGWVVWKGPGQMDRKARPVTSSITNIIRRATLEMQQYIFTFNSSFLTKIRGVLRQAPSYLSQQPSSNTMTCYLLCLLDLTNGPVQDPQDHQYQFLVQYVFQNIKTILNHLFFMGFFSHAYLGKIFLMAETIVKKHVVFVP